MMDDKPELHTTFSPFLVGLLILATLDTLLYGGFMLGRPSQVHSLLTLPPARDALLWRIVGLAVLGHLPFLVLALWRPRQASGFLLVGVLGRALLAGMWGWLLLSTRVTFEHDAVILALLHDLGMAILLLFLEWNLSRRKLA